MNTFQKDIIPKMIDNQVEEHKVLTIRKDFPILSDMVNGSPLVYLDNAATSQKPLSVINGISDFYLHHNSNVHRGVHSLSQQATVLYEVARKSVQHYLNAEKEEEIIFTRGTTESINLLAHSLSGLIQEGDEIISTEMEHHSNFVPWQSLALQRKATFKVARISDKGELSLDELASSITDKTKILAITHASNTLGTINDIREVCRMAHQKNCMVVVDGAQYIPHGKVDVKDLDCDFYAFSGHKLFGPTGIGVLYGKKELLDSMPPYQYGGGMIEEVTLQSTSYIGSPQVFEAGTPNIAGAHGLRIAIDYVESLGHDFIKAHEKALLEYATKEMEQLPGITIYGTSKNKVSLISFLIKDVHPFDLGTMLDQMGVAVRTGHHCTQPIMTKFGIPGSVRASFAFYNTFEEIDALVNGIKKAVNILK
jgi:cysteine desulfurase/selenocysteine lyase